MSPVHALDRYYLALTLLVTVAYQLSGFAIAWTLQFDKITDFTGGSNFFFLALLTLLSGNTYHARNIVASVLVMIWAIRIAGFLLFRVLKMGSDSRFDEIRSHFWKFLGFWIGQILWIWTVSLPLTILNSPAVSEFSSGGSNPEFGTSRDIAGLVLWSLGFFVESVGDAQKYYYKALELIPKGQPMSRGLWKWSRHPPYFGEIMCWWGIWILCLSPTTNGHLSSSARAAQYGAIVSPVFTVFLLMFGSGLPTAEKPTAKKFYLLSHGPDSDAEDRYANAWTEYKAYLHKTSILLPLPPVLYRPLPAILKRTLLLDFPIYQFDESKGGVNSFDAEHGRPT
ncbi:DUF1295-domain-containing protein [Pholiota conissans]|uniref:DUF1295-domain-containing protein n=1 Tax=Pholiota conissans TaxID=109636 RepID=A0A9P5YZW7_9AGAR|nr:DUF1295-domain-containing protein [Pholiota conissans]